MIEQETLSLSEHPLNPNPIKSSTIPSIINLKKLINFFILCLSCESSMEFLRCKGEHEQQSHCGPSVDSENKKQCCTYFYPLYIGNAFVGVVCGLMEVWFAQQDNKPWWILTLSIWLLIWPTCSLTIMKPFNYNNWLYLNE